MPTSVRRSQNESAEPSSTGISPWTLISRLVIPRAWSADSRCSTVRMLSPSRESVVAYSVSATESRWAGICVPFGSVRKWMPELGGSGCIAIPVRLPEWRPSP